MSKAWCQLRSGAAFDIRFPDPDKIRLSEIAHCLACIPRFNGHTTSYLGYSVAQHCVLAASAAFEAPALMRVFILFHDAHEYITGDITSPMQAAIMEELRESEDGYHGIHPIRRIQQRIDAAIREAIGIDEKLYDDAAATVVKAADLRELAVEKRDYMAPPQRPWEPTYGELPEVPWPGVFRVMAVPEVEEMFLSRAKSLIEEANLTPLKTFWE